jgi:hypothetical protein
MTSRAFREPLPERVLTEEQLRAEALRRVRRALALIEQAQNDLSSACVELSALEGGSRVWAACVKLHVLVHGVWHRVDEFRASGRFKLDGTNVAALARRLQQQATTP